MVASTTPTEDPIVSVCIQTYQHKNYIRKAIESVLMQKTDFPFEILIGEDESTDGTRDICIEYANKYPNKIRLFLNSRKNVIRINGQPTGKWNFTNNIKNSRGKYIAILPGDDYWTDSTKLQKQVDFLKNHPDFSGCFHETQQIMEDGKLGGVYGKNAKPIMYAEDTLTTLAPFHSSSFLFKNDFGEFPDWFYQTVSGDMALFSICASYGPLGKIPGIMSVYRKLNSGLTNTKGVTNHYHRDRITLTQNLNEYHNFKFDKKAKDVIKYHVNNIADSNQSLNKLERFLENWKNVIIPQNVKTIATMLSNDERKFLYALTRDYWSGFGAVVDGGCFLGGSTLSLAMGLLENENKPNKKIIHTYDLFVADQHQCNSYLKKFGNYFPGDSTRSIFDKNISEVSNLVNVFEGDLNNYKWTGEPIEILFIDVSKTWELNDHIVKEFFVHLIPNHSVVIQQDFLHPTCPWLAITMELFAEYFEPIEYAPSNSIIFLFKKEIPAEFLNNNIVSKLSKEEKLLLMNNAVERYSKLLTKEEIVELECARAILTLNQKGSYETEQELNQIKTKYAGVSRLDAAVKWVDKRIDKYKQTHNELNIVNDPFINPELSEDNMDLYWIRRSILNFLKGHLSLFKGILLDIGCGKMPYKQYILSNSKVKKYIGLDIENPTYQQTSKPDLFWDGKKIPLDENSIDTAFATELFEHLPDINSVLKEINRVLKPGGALFFTVPFLWPIHDAPYDEYRYTPFALEKHLKSTDFSSISIQAMGGWNASLAQMIGLWLKRSGLSQKEKDFFTKDLFNFYNHLLQNDVVPQAFQDQLMSTGFSGIAYKNDAPTFQEKEHQNPLVKANVECPVCGGSFTSFLPFGSPVRENSLCPKCQSLERHRLLWLYLKEKTDFFKKNLTVLDIAPTKVISERIKSLKNIDYLSIDIKSPLAMRHMDITDLDLPDNSFDCVLCCHVLEHVPNDRKAMSEILRVLKPGGWAILQVPLDNKLKNTIEGAHLPPQERARLFGLEDHVRSYGIDYQQRLVEVGFDVNIDDFSKKFSNEDRMRYRIAKNEDLYICRKSFIDIKSHKKVVTIEAGFPTVSETFILDQLTGLIDRGGEIENWALFNTDTKTIHEDIVKYDLLNKTRYITLPHISLKKDPQKWLQDFMNKNNIRDFNDIHSFHVHFGENFNLFEPLFRVINKFVLVSFHGYDASKYFQLMGDHCYDFLFKRADRITTPSHFMKNELVKRGCDPDKVIIHRYGIDLKRFSCKYRNFKKDKIVFLTIGRFVEKKGIEYSLKAFAKIHKDINSEYRIIGEGQLHDKLMEIVTSEGIKDKVKFLGAKTKDEVIEEMINADVFVLTSVVARDGDSEGVPVSLTEAHAMGLPVVSTYHSGIPELVIHEKTGLLSKEKDVESIARNMLKIASDIDLRKSYSKNAKERVKDEFDIKKLNDRLFSILYESSAENIESPEISVSVIMAAHNAEKYIQKAIYSVLNQTYQNFELIIVNDASTDKTEKILSQYNDPKIKIIKNEENIGSAGSRNKALNIAKGKYIAIMDSDDVSLPHRFAVEVEYLERNPDVALVGSSFYEIDEKNQIKKTIKVLTDSNSIKNELLKQNWFGHSTVMIRRDIMSRFGGYDESYLYSHDYDLFLRVSEKYKTANIKEPLCCWRSTSKAISSSKAEEQRYYADLAVKTAIERRKEQNSPKEKPLVSVIVPTYNRPDMLKNAIKSILAQSFQNFEIMVINDNGVDVESIVNNLNKGVNKITHIRHSYNKGLAAARNTGIMAARGKYIALLDDDDIFYPEHIETAINELKGPQRVVYTDAVRATYRKKDAGYELIDKTIPYSMDYKRNKLLLGNIAPVNCFLFEKTLAIQAGLFDETLSTLEDWDLWIKLSFLTDFTHISKPTVQVNWRTDGTTMTSSRHGEFNKNRTTIYNKNKNEINKIPNAEEIMAEFKAIWSKDEIKSYQDITAKKELKNTNLTSIIILTFNQLKYTKRCLKSIAKYTSVSHELIIVDNGSTDGTRDYLESYKQDHPECKIILNESNLGFAAGNNQGIAAARGDYILLLNNDIVVTQNWLERMIVHMNSDQNIGMVGPVSNYVSGPQLIDNTGYGNSIKKMHEFAINHCQNNTGKQQDVMRLVGFCLLIKREVLDIIGGLDENYGSGNFEDDDLCLRSAIAGYRNVIVHDVFVHHYGNITFKGNAIDYRESLEDNREYFAHKWRGIVEFTGDKYSVYVTKEPRLNKILEWGEEQFSKGNFNAAIKIFERILKLDPMNAQALNNLGVVQWQLNDIPSSIKSFQTALSANPEDTDAIKNLMEATEESGRSDLLDKSILDKFLEWGEEQFSSGNLDSAANIFERILKLDPMNAQALNNLGVIQWQLGDIPSAIKSFQVALSANPGDTDAIKNLLEAVEESGRTDLLDKSILDKIQQSNMPNMQSDNEY